MVGAEPVDLDLSRLTKASEVFASRLFQRLPELRARARMVAYPGSDGFDLLVEIPSPSGDTKRQVVAWMEDRVEPSVGFGEWHTHASVQCSSEDPTLAADSIVDLIHAILADEVVLIYDVGGTHDGNWGLVDLREEDALLEELTGRSSPGRVRIWTWSGRDDREVGLGDVTVD